MPTNPIVSQPLDPCRPSPCGPNSACRPVNGQPVCSCQPNYIGRPPGCRPECVVSTECPTNRACVNQKCVDPCPTLCGDNADCRVINRSPICSCRQEFTGDAFVTCFPVSRQYILNDEEIIKPAAFLTVYIIFRPNITINSAKSLCTNTLRSVFTLS